MIVAASCLSNELAPEAVNEHRRISAPDVIVAELPIVIESTREHLSVQSHEDRVVQSTSRLDDLPC